MNIIRRLNGEMVLVAMNNKEAATLLTMEAAAEQAAEKTAWEEWGDVMEAAKEEEERAARLCAARAALLHDAAKLADGKASLFRISGTDRRGMQYTTHETDPVKAAEVFDRYRMFCKNVKLEFPVPRG